jgi:hypothetical protein
MFSDGGWLEFGELASGGAPAYVGDDHSRRAVHARA